MMVGIVIGLIYLSVSVVYQRQKAEQWKKQIQRIQQDYLSAKTKFETTRGTMLNKISSLYGEDRAEQLDQGGLWHEMPSHLVVVSKGKAEDVKKSFLRGKNIERWYYGGFVNRLGTRKYKLELTFENELLVGWKDLN
jgi:hypothetical protein